MSKEAGFERQEENSRLRAVDAGTGDCFYFVAGDALDPTLPKMYALLTDGGSKAWSVEILGAVHAPKDFLDGLAPGADYLAVVKSTSGLAGTPVPQDRAKSAFEALLGRPLHILFVEDWAGLQAARQAAHQAWARAGYPGRIPERVPLKRYLRELKPIGWALLFALLIIWMESARH